MVMDSGWIKIHRKIMDWDWYNDDVTKSIYLHLLLTVNYESKVWKGILIEAGERVFSIRSLAKETRHTERQTRTALEHLKSTHEVTIKTTHQYSVLKVLNYGLYQGFDLDERHTERHTERQAIDTPPTHEATHEATTTKEIKNKEIEEFKEKDISSKTEDSKPKPEKKAYGELDNVFLTDDEFSKLEARYGTEKTMKSIEYLSLYKPDKNYKNKSDYASIIRWVANAIDEQNERKNKYSPNKKQANDDFFSGIADWVSKNQEGGIEDGCEPIW